MVALQVPIMTDLLMLVIPIWSWMLPLMEAVHLEQLKHHGQRLELLRDQLAFCGFRRQSRAHVPAARVEALRVVGPEHRGEAAAWVDVEADRRIFSGSHEDAAWRDRRPLDVLVGIERRRAEVRQPLRGLPELRAFRRTHQRESRLAARWDVV